MIQNSKNTLNISLNSRGFQPSWDEANYSWDESTGTWDNPTNLVSLNTKNSIVLSQNSKN